MALLFDVPEANQFCWETSPGENEEQSSQAIPRQRTADHPVLPVHLFIGKLKLPLPLLFLPLFFHFFHLPTILSLIFLVLFLYFSLYIFSFIFIFQNLIILHSASPEIFSGNCRNNTVEWVTKVFRCISNPIIPFLHLTPYSTTSVK
jgi:hypothetical protein